MLPFKCHRNKHKPHFVSHKRKPRYDARIQKGGDLNRVSTIEKARHM